jgi:nucleotide-binding universal stress UspA family protein
MRFVAATDTVETSELLADYLRDRVTEADTVHAVNSQVGGDETSSEEIRTGEEAVERLAAALPITVETHQFVRGNQPPEDVLALASRVDADELVLSVRERSPAGKAIFGSVGQRLLLESSLPMRVVPRD